MKRIIINGDDFGMNERCSRAIALAFSRALITDTTMMANGAFFDGAVALAREQGFLDGIGVHFNLTEGEPLTDAIRSVPDFVTDGQFHKGFLLRPRSLGNAEQNAVYAELCAQAERLTAAGVAITHADSHHYIHNRPQLAPIAAQACLAFGIRRVRLQRNLADAAGYEENNRFWREQGFLTTAHFGRMTELAKDDIPDLTEIMVHPDLDRDGVLIDRRGIEDGCPVGDRLRDLKNETGVTLWRYRDLS